MNILANAKIGVRLGLAFGLQTFFLVGCAVFGATQLASLNGVLDTVVEGSVRPAILALELEAHAHELGSALRDAVLSDARAEIQAQLKVVADLRQRSEATLKQVKSAIATDTGRAAVEKIVATSPAYFAAIDKAVEAIKSGDTDEGRSRIVSPELRQARAAYLGALEKLVTHEREAMDAANAGADVSYARSLKLLVAVVVGSAALAALVAFWVTRSITRPIREAVQIAETVAAGDLRSRIEARGSDETGQLLAALVKMNAALARVVAQVRTGSNAIAQGSARIADGSSHLSDRTEQQASNLEETAASMEELGSTVKSNADTAREATQLASSASVVAVSGGEKVNEVVGTMSAIAASSRKISEIIGVIDGIAFQTNILALNAAVEAARAGEHGRGFAVVASEVRALAQRSAGAAKEIKVLINDSVSKVEAGTAQVGDAGRRMEDIVVEVSKVSDLISRISAATAEQSAGIDQVGGAVTELDRVTQQNAALVEESTQAAELLRRQAAELVAAVQVFKLADEAGAPVASVPAVAVTAAPEEDHCASQERLAA